MELIKFLNLEKFNVDKSIDGKLVPYVRSYSHGSENPYHKSIHFENLEKKELLNIHWRFDGMITVELNDLKIVNEWNSEKRKRLYHSQDFSQEKLNEILNENIL